MFRATGFLGGGVFLAGWLLAAGGALACAICFNGRITPVGQRIDAADAVVLAMPAGASGLFSVTRTVKGTVPAGTLLSDVAAGPKVPALATGTQFLLRNRLSHNWVNLGAIGVGEADWLRKFAALGVEAGSAGPAVWPRTAETTGELDDAAWMARLALVVPHLESSEPLSAEIAYGEISRAPYRLMRSTAGMLDAGRIAGWLDDPALVARQPAYTLLLGIAGGPRAEEAIGQRLAAAAAAHNAKNLSALIAADLELHGPARLAWVEQTYFADTGRTLPEIEAALLALSVQGTADAAIPRQDVIAAYRAFIRLRQPMAAFVAQDLGDWGYWDASADYIEILKSGAIKDPASRLSIVGYLRRNPNPPTADGLQAFTDLPL